MIQMSILGFLFHSMIVLLRRLVIPWHATAHDGTRGI
jgi:hypothetical protein